MDEGRKAQGARYKVKRLNFFPCALSLEPYASSPTGFWLLTTPLRLESPARTLFGILNYYPPSLKALPDGVGLFPFFVFP